MKYSIQQVTVTGSDQNVTIPATTADSDGLLQPIQKVIFQPVGAGIDLVDPDTNTLLFPIADGASLEIASSDLPGKVFKFNGTVSNTLRVLQIHNP